MSPAGPSPQMQPVGAFQAVVSNVPRFSWQKPQNWSFDSKPALIWTDLAAIQLSPRRKTVNHRRGGDRYHPVTGEDLLSPPPQGPWWCDRKRGNRWGDKMKRDFGKRDLEPGSPLALPIISCVTLG